jgi:hypothetical protein
MPDRGERVPGNGEATPGTHPCSREETRSAGPSGGNPRQNEGFSMQRDDGSWSEGEDGKPVWDRNTVLENEFDYRHENGRYAYTVLKGRRLDGDKAFLIGRRFAGAPDMLRAAQQDAPDQFYRHRQIENYEKGKGGEPDLLYRLPELLADAAARPDDPIFVCEGEKDAETARSHGLIATTSPNGAGKFRRTFAKYFADRDVAVVPDADNRGREHGNLVASILFGTARSVKVIDLWQS